MVKGLFLAWPLVPYILAPALFVSATWEGSGGSGESRALRKRQHTNPRAQRFVVAGRGGVFCESLRLSLQPLTRRQWGPFKMSICSSLQNGKVIASNSKETAQSENNL